jgi:hypothetical protein
MRIPLNSRASTFLITEDLMKKAHDERKARARGCGTGFQPVQAARRFEDRCLLQSRHRSHGLKTRATFGPMLTRGPSAFVPRSP